MFGKKRGHRHTGSKTLRGAGEAMFFACLLLVGIAFLMLLLARVVIPEWRASHDFREVTARVDEKKIESSTDRDGNPVFIPKVKIHFDLDGHTYADIWTYDISVANYLRSNGRDDQWTFNVARTQLSTEADARELLDPFEIGQDYRCWYDPLDPTVAVLVRGYRWWFWMLLLVPVGFILIGGGRLMFTLWHWGRSPEHRAARGQMPRIDLFDEMTAAAREFPAVPRDTDITNSPGTHLKFRLPTHTSQGWRLLAATVACLIWNGIVAVLIVLAIRQHWHGEGDWRLDLFVVPFLLVGGYLIYYFVRELLIATGVGPTLIEISDHPLRPGKTYSMYVSQGGHLSMQSLEVRLECEEQATYRQGTDTRTDRRLVFRQHLFRRDQFEILPGEPFEANFEFCVPAEAMHSFKSLHNLVQWTLVMRGAADGWPPFQRSFPVVVYPQSFDRAAPPEAQHTNGQALSV
jgi:Protein of unknown function (DUF3592)